MSFWVVVVVVVALPLVPKLIRNNFRYVTDYITYKLIPQEVCYVICVLPTSLPSWLCHFSSLKPSSGVTQSLFLRKPSQAMSAQAFNRHSPFTKSACLVLPVQYFHGIFDKFRLRGQRLARCAEATKTRKGKRGFDLPLTHWARSTFPFTPRITLHNQNYFWNNFCCVTDYITKKKKSPEQRDVSQHNVM